MELHLETSLEPAVFAETLARIGHPLLKANYDSGNSSSLGYKPRDEFAVYGPRVGSVHIKDRVLGGTTVPLGTGDADFASLFDCLDEVGYTGDFILQVARDVPGQEVAWARANREFVLARFAAASTHQKGAGMRLLVVGLGGIGQRHVRNLRTLLGDSAEIYAYRVRRTSPTLTDRLTVDEESDVEEKYQIRVVSDLDDALSLRPDAVLICNPSSLHMPVALAAARAGCDLFIEKPLSHNEEHVGELIDLVEERGLVTLVGYQLRFHPCVHRLQSLLREHAIGNVLAVRIEVGEYLPGWHTYEDYRQMYASRAELGGGVILSQIHELDYVYSLFGLPQRLFAIGGHLSDLEIDVEDTASILMECIVEGRTVPVHVHQDYVQRPPSRTCEVIGSAGKILVDFHALSLTQFGADGQIAVRDSFEGFDRNELFLDEMRHFLACLEARADIARNGARRCTEPADCPGCEGIPDVRECPASGRGVRMTDPRRLFDLTGRVAVITGGLGLLGRQHAEAIASMGAVTVLADVRVDDTEFVEMKSSGRLGPSACAIAADITSPDSVQALLAEILERFGHVDILINNAANNPTMSRGSADDAKRLETFPLARWDADIGVGLTGAFLCSQILGTEMATQGRGVIVNVASDLALIGPDQRLYRQPGVPEDQQPTKPVTYSVVKSGLLGLTRYLATYWAQSGVRANSISPGGVYDGQDDAFVGRLTDLIPLGRMANVDEYHGAILFLCSDASSYMTGANLVVDGGRTCW